MSVPPRSPDRAGGGRGTDFVQSLSRGLDVIRAFGAERPRQTLTEVARSTGLTRAAARRFLLTLVELGYVRTDGKHFSLTPQILDLGFAYLSGLSLAEVAQPHVVDLASALHESSSVSVLDRDDVVYVVRVPAKRIMTVTISVGTRFPAWATSMGRVLLAGLTPAQLEEYFERVTFVPLTRHSVTDVGRLRQIVEQSREEGFALTDQELEEGLRSTAAPIRDAEGQVIAAVNASTQASRMTMEEMRRVMLPRVLEAASRIETDLASRHLESWGGQHASRLEPQAP